MAIKNIIAKGVGFTGGEGTKWIPTHGFSIGASTAIAPEAHVTFLLNRQQRQRFVTSAQKRQRITLRD